MSAKTEGEDGSSGIGIARMGDGNGHGEAQDHIKSDAGKSELRTGMSATKMSRSMSLRKPTGITHSEDASRHRSHLRTRSTAQTVAPPSSHSTLQKANVERSTSAAQSEASAGTSNDEMTCPSISRKTSVRHVPGHSRVASAVNFEKVASVAERTRQPKSCAPDASARTDTSKLLTKPTFSIHQQHFSPKKSMAAKPTMSSILAPPTKPSESATALPVESIRLQAELLQLCILYDSSHRTFKEWNLDARRKLRQKFEEVASLHEIARKEEQEAQERLNLLALQQWGMGSSGTLAERVQLLSGILQELCSLIDRSGRYTRLITDFERWLNWVENVRTVSSSGTSASFEFIEGLGDAYKAEHAALTRKVAALTRDLEILPIPTTGSAMAATMSQSKAMLRGMIDELQAIHSLETELVSREKDRVEEGLMSIAFDIEQRFSAAEVGVESWRT